MMYTKLIIDGNAVYEIDEECMEKRCRQMKELERQKKEVPVTEEQTEQ